VNRPANQKQPSRRPGRPAASPRHALPAAGHGAPATRPAAAAPSAADLPSVIFTAIGTGAAPIAASLNMPNLLPVDEAGLGDFPWFWQNGTNFNDATYNWLNSLFTYSSDGYVGTAGEAFTTAYFNVLLDTAYVLDAQDAAALNAANLKAATVINTIISDWTTFSGPFPAGITTQSQQVNYVTAQVLSWGAPGLTLGQLRNSTNPSSLLPNIPLGGNQVVNDLMTYLGLTSSVANIQAAVVSFNQQLSQTRNNVDPSIPLTAVAPGFMQTVNDSGTTSIVPLINIAESTGQIQNALLPTSGGNSFSTSFTATAGSSNTVQITAQGGASGEGAIDDLLVFSGSAEASLNIFSFASDLTSCAVTLTFNGVTTVTPSFAAYNISTGTGWWNPDPIEEAANPVPNQSGYVFTPTPAYDFTVNGTFGAVARLLISQQPVISLVYTTTQFSQFQQVFQEQSSWGVSFLGIPLGGGSQSYYSAQATQSGSGTTVTVTMSPAGISTPISAADQLAYVIGAQIRWPGASQTQQLAGI